MKSFRFAAIILSFICGALLLSLSPSAIAQVVEVGSQNTTTAGGSNAATAGTTINNGSNKTIGSGADCRVITNNTGRQIFIPTGNTTMWQRYIASAAPTGVTIASCNANCASAGVSWGSGCSGTAPIINHGTSASVTNTAGGYTGSVTVTCTNGVRSQSAATCTAVVNGACNNAVALGCSAGTAISDNGQTACGTNRQWVCQGSGGGTNSGTCSKANAACSNCTAPWGATVNHGTGVTAYLSSAPTGACTSETRNCTNGSLSGTYTAQSCNAGCTGTPWGNVAHGYSNTAYLSAAPTGACTSQVRTCTSGTMSGTYTVTSCNAGCTGTPWGNVAHGYSNTAYTSSSVACGGSCATVASTRTCSNGTLGGSGSFTSCSVAACPVNGVCGAYANCSAGSLSGDNGATSCGTNRTWNCLGSNGGSNASCSAYNGACGSGGGGGGGCFVTGTKIKMSDGSYKAIEHIKQGDLVQGQTLENMIMAVDVYETDEPTYSINGGRHFITGEHPVMTTNGWAAIDPELTRLEYSHTKDERIHRDLGNLKVLSVGDVMLTEGGKKVVIHSIDTKENSGHEQKLYNLRMNGDHTYYADGVLVHNLGGGEENKH
jgi:hypothetical protein